MIPRVSIFLIHLLISRSSAFSHNKNGGRGRIRILHNEHVSTLSSISAATTTTKATTITSTAIQAFANNGGRCPISERRKFLTSTMRTVATLASTSTISPNQAFAATSTPEPNKYGVPSNKRVGGLANKIRNNMCNTMDEMQRDLMQERW